MCDDQHCVRAHSPHCFPALFAVLNALLIQKSSGVGKNPPGKMEADTVPHRPQPADARRVTRALDLLLIPLLDYVLPGETVTSLRQRQVIQGNSCLCCRRGTFNTSRNKPHPGNDARMTRSTLPLAAL